MSNHFISLSQAVEMTTRYRSRKETILEPEYRGKNTLLLAETFTRDAFDALLAEDGCVSIRVYFGMTEDLQVRTIFVGVNKDDEDLLPPIDAGLKVQETTTGTNRIVEEGAPCPEFCPKRSALNQP